MYKDLKMPTAVGKDGIERPCHKKCMAKARLIDSRIPKKVSKAGNIVVARFNTKKEWDIRQKLTTQEEQKIRFRWGGSQDILAIKGTHEEVERILYKIKKHVKVIRKKEIP